MQTGSINLEGGYRYTIFKKRDATNLSNYRGITVTTVILKVIEHILNRRHFVILDYSQSSIQKGFTQGRSSIDVALILLECISEAKNEKKSLIVATMDAQKAFKVVGHDILLRRLYLDGLVPTGYSCVICILTLPQSWNGKEHCLLRLSSSRESVKAEFCQLGTTRDITFLCWLSWKTSSFELLSAISGFRMSQWLMILRWWATPHQKCRLWYQLVEPLQTDMFFTQPRVVSCHIGRNIWNLVNLHTIWMGRRWAG